MQTRSQKYAVAAWDRVAQSRKLAKFDKAKYGGMAHKLPVLIQTSGLAQALAFVAARGDQWHLLLLDDLAATLGKNRLDLLSDSRNLGLSEYMLLTQRALDALLWFKRLAQSELGVIDASAGDIDAAVPSSPEGGVS